MEKTNYNFNTHEKEECFMHIEDGSFFMYEGTLFLKIELIESSLKDINAINCKSGLPTCFNPKENIILVKNASFEY